MRPTAGRSRVRFIGSPAKRALPTEVRLYETLIRDEEPNYPSDPSDDDFDGLINPDSIEVLPAAQLEPSVADFSGGDAFQLERLGYFCIDSKSGSATDSPNRVVNRTVTLRDSWAKVAKKKGA